MPVDQFDWNVGISRCYCMDFPKDATHKAPQKNLKMTIKGSFIVLILNKSLIISSLRLPQAAGHVR